METPHHVCTCAPKLEAGPEESSVSHDKPCSEKQKGAVVTLKGPQTLTLLPYICVSQVQGSVAQPSVGLNRSLV